MFCSCWCMSPTVYKVIQSRMTTAHSGVWKNVFFPSLDKNEPQRLIQAGNHLFTWDVMWRHAHSHRWLVQLGEVQWVTVCTERGMWGREGFFGLFSVPSRTSLLLCEMGELGGGVSLVSWWWRWSGVCHGGCHTKWSMEWRFVICGALLLAPVCLPVLCGLAKGLDGFSLTLLMAEKDYFRNKLLLFYSYIWPWKAWTYLILDHIRVHYVH